MASSGLLHGLGRPFALFKESGKQMPVHTANGGIISGSHLGASLTSFGTHLNGNPAGSGFHFQMPYLTFLQVSIFYSL